MTSTDGLADELVAQLLEGNEQVLADLFSQHRDRLWRMVNFRLDRRLAGRVDADDILQEAYLAASQRIRHYLENPSKSFFVWLRLITRQTLVDVHRRHLGAKMRSAGRETANHPGYPMATSISLVAQLLGSMTSPSQAVVKAEMTRQLEVAIEEMDPIDREVLALRHFEELTNSEVAEWLDIQQKAASIRYVRAVTRLKDILARVPGFFDTQERKP